MSDAELALYRKHTGRTARPNAPAREAWMVIGRRGGKAGFMALVAAYLALFRDYAPYLSPGEVATVALIAADRRQARVLMGYIRALLKPDVLAQRVERETAEGFDLVNGVRIEVHTANFRATRGYSYACVIADEIAFWMNDESSANPDTEILNAIRPGMATLPTSMLICASSPHARRGELWNAYRRYWGKDGAPLVWKATTAEMNPTIDPRIIEDALERDPAAASAEYLAEFRTDVETFISREAVEACVSLGAIERGRVGGISYRAFVDPSGGSSDAMTLAIAHREGDRIVLDAVRERRPPFSPESVVAEFCGTLRSYGISAVTGDRYAGEWAREPFRKRGIGYQLAEKTRSDLYLALLPLLNSKRVDLLDSDKAHQPAGRSRAESRARRQGVHRSRSARTRRHCEQRSGIISLLAKARSPSVIVSRYGPGPDNGNPLVGTSSWFADGDLDSWSP